MKPIIFDVETLPLPVDQMLPMEDDWVPLGNTTDPVKVKAKILEYKFKWEQEGATRPETGKVAMVGFLPLGDDEPVIMSGDEKPLLESVMATIRDQILAGGHLVGFFSNYFDLPFLVRRCWVNNIPIACPLRDRKWWNQQCIDLWDIWCFGDRQQSRGTTTLASVAKQLGLPPKLGKGEDFGQMDEKQRVEYLTRDLQITAGIYERLCL